MVTLSGDYITKVFEGEYREAKNWFGEMQELVRTRGKEPGRIYFFYTTCPKCAKTTGRTTSSGWLKHRLRPDRRPAPQLRPLHTLIVIAQR